mmetsp:Transcript_62254/g.197015  ORF Transcript_62254/g.197015 Transcript_62254/m.197015 type:complete len:275 (-) Transcript_62254:379-1203(-)
MSGYGRSSPQGRGGHGNMMGTPGSAPGMGLEPPTMSRIRQLSTKLVGIHTGLEAEKQSRREVLSMRIKALEEKLSRANIGGEPKYKVLRDQIAKLQDGLATERIARELVDERKGKELTLVESSAALEVNLERQARKDAETRLARILEERSGALEADLARAKKARGEGRAAHERSVAEEVERLAGALEAEAVAAEESAVTISSSFQEEVAALDGMLGADARARAETEAQMQQMLESVFGKMQSDIAQERREREEMEDTLLGILEQSCRNVESSLH